MEYKIVCNKTIKIKKIIKNEVLKYQIKLIKIIIFNFS